MCHGADSGLQFSFSIWLFSCSKKWSRMSTTPSDPFTDTTDDCVFRRQVQLSASRSTTSSVAETTSPMGKVDGDEKSMMNWKDIATCHLISPGSPVTAAIAVVKATLGAAPFAVAYAMATGGFVAGIVLLVAMSVLNVLSLEYIVNVVEKTGKTSYVDIVDHLMGRKVGYIFQFAVIAFSLGSCATYLVTMFDILSPVFSQLLIGQENTWYGKMLTERVYLSLVLAVFVLYPISLVKNISSLRYLTLCGSIGVCYLAVVAIYLLICYGPSDSFELSQAAGPVNWVLLLQAVNTFIFASCNQANIPEIYAEMHPRSLGRMRWVAVVSAVISLAAYISIGVIYFVVFGYDTQSNIILNLSAWIPEGNVVVIAAFILSGIAFIVSYPLNVHPIKVTILNAAKPKRPDLWAVVIVTSVIAISYVVAVVLPDVSVILGLVGAIAGSILSFIAPGAFALAISEKRFKFFCRENIKPSLLFIFGCITLVLGTCISFYQIIEYYSY